jgi:hypothetical protein
MLRSLTRCRHRGEVQTLRRKRSPASFTHRESAIDVEEDHEWAHGDLEGRRSRGERRCFGFVCCAPWSVDILRIDEIEEMERTEAEQMDASE